ncbi:hypothetical protein [Sandaracinus amylolyticus]|uniref:hypothetical protein n=1 Tax=Sandaracinus amylolyticus TaxID=927083 RepID=UPI001F28A703|nr:hypothetical protein [Sandaracinus amylolyticus]UJR81491.1 Hypothetical protein I5071_35510 [Sandaracinus amylolyticus]
MRPETCPWAGFFDPDVQLVRWAHGFWSAGLHHAWGDEPESWLVEAVAFYHRALEAAAQAAREKPQGPGPGGITVEEKPGGGLKIRG